ncbi:hypothetical protein GVAV_001221, partial [Gurleya vavrai]
KFKKIESEAKCNVLVFFSFEDDKFAFKSITDIKNDLFSKLNIENSDKSIIAFEYKNCSIDFYNWEKYNLKRILTKIEQKLENSDIELSEISPDHDFGIIINGILDTKKKNLKGTSIKDVNIGDRSIEGKFCTKIIGNDFVFPELISPLKCFFSNFQMTKPDLEYCFKIFDAEKIQSDNFKTSFCCLALKINDNKIKNFPKLSNVCCKSYSNEEKIFESKNHCYTHVKPKILNSETNLNNTNACLFHNNKQKSIATLFSDNKCRCVIEKPLKIRFDAKNYCFKLSVLNEASEKAQNTLKILYPSAKIEKILICTLQELFKKQFIYFYKISENLEVEIENEKIQILKITVIVFFKIGKFTNQFEFFYFENFDKKSIDYEIEKIQKSQILFVNFFKNLICLLQKDNFGFYENYNIFYYMFLHPNIEPCHIRCSFFYYILSTEKITSYINYIKLICDTYEKEGFKFELYKFKCENFNLINDNYCSIFEYNDQKVITDLQIVDKNNIFFEKNYYFMIKNLNFKDVKANLCILPYFENNCNDRFEVKKEKLIKSFEYFKNNIFKESNSHQSESKKMRMNENFESHEIIFIKENVWLTNFFDEQSNIENIESFFNNLRSRDIKFLSDEDIELDVKNKFIVGCLRRNFLKFETDKQNYLNGINTEFTNLSIKIDEGLTSMNYEEKFAKVILHLFEQNQDNFKYGNFEFPKSVKMLFFYYDEKTYFRYCFKLQNILKNNEKENILYQYFLDKSDKTIESI